MTERSNRSSARALSGRTVLLNALFYDKIEIAGFVKVSNRLPLRPNFQAGFYVFS